MRRIHRFSVIAIAVGSLAGCYDGAGFGIQTEQLLRSQSMALFGVAGPLQDSAAATNGPYRSLGQNAEDQVDLAASLSVSYLTREAANKTDMMAFWPSDESPTHLITCVEGSREVIGTFPDGSDKYNPSVQAIDLATGAVSTLLRGMSGCDGIRRTPWGTVLVTEERSDGAAYEILDPLSLEDATILERSSGQNTAPTQVVRRDALPQMAWEGLTVLENGVVIAGDELRPGTGSLDDDGGSLFKFVPTTFWEGGMVASLDQSPLVSGRVYALTVSCREVSSSKFPQYGQGCEVGDAAWVKIDDPSQARTQADARGATGYYRPEDLHRDPDYQGEGVRFCWSNTGREKAHHYGEVMCAIDHNPMAADERSDERTGLVYLADGQDYAWSEVNRFVEGDTDFNSFDNLAFRPGTGQLYVVEDHPNGDVFACLADGADRDIKSDGCVKILSVKDSSAEPTGFIFSADGARAYLSIQHSDDANMPLIDDYRTDDVLVISGFEAPQGQ